MEHSILQRWAEARRETDRLFALLHPDALYERPVPERHRLIFYVGHLEAFDWNLLRGDKASFHPTFDKLFAFGIDPIGNALPMDQPHDWPPEHEVREYGSTVRETLDSASHSDLMLNVAIEHRLMHAETLAYLLHQLPLELKRRPDNNETSATQHPASSSRPVAEKSQMIHIPSGEITMGQPDRTSFGWDNEFDAMTVDVPEFEIDRYKVTNGDYLEFMRDGGVPPAFWVQRGSEWFLRTMFDEIPLPLDWPVYVSHAYASAYARWAGKALPTEAEWQRAALGATPSCNCDFHSWDPAPVNATESRGEFGVVEMRGNGWEWTSTLFAPFPGFQCFDFYPGYSADFFDGRHYVMLGGSVRTAACMMRSTFRNWFQPDYPYVYTGFRCVRRA